MTNNYVHPDGMEHDLQPRSADVVAPLSAFLSRASGLGVPYWFANTSCGSESDAMSRVWEHHNVAGTWACETVDGLAAAVRESAGVIGKPGYDSFAGTRLAHELAARGVGSLALAGGLTEVCVMMTAVSAFHLGLRVLLLEDLLYSCSGPAGEAASEWMAKYLLAESVCSWSVLGS